MKGIESDSRISSIAPRMSETYAYLAYLTFSKLANILHARELQRRYPQITATSLHPGVLSHQIALDEDS